MSDRFRHNYLVWDKFFDLLFLNDETITDEQIDVDLKRFGINMESANARLHAMVEVHCARVRLTNAREIRATIGERVKNIVAPHMENLRGGIKDLIGKAVKGEEQLAYFHKLEGAASEDDLQTLMDDLEKLAAIRELNNETQSE